MTKQKKELSEQELLQKVQVLQAKKQQAFLDEINKVCEKHGFVLETTKPQIVVIPKER